MRVERPVVTPERAAELSDRELLRRFQTGQDESAFATILQRHGTMVLRVCQRVLERREDAEDAFQATFLVLARKAGSVTWQDSVATWLHAAAHRLAHEVRRSQIRRQVREARRPVPPDGDALAEVTSRELLAILDEELTGLPDDYRGPLLLCCMEGMSGDEAAAHLGCSPSTLKRRLRAARELLQARLVRRGIALSAAALLTVLAAGTAVAKLPTTLAANTLQAATLFKSGAVLPPGLVSSQAVSLTRLLLPALSAKIKIAIGLLLLGSIGTALVMRGENSTKEDKPAREIAIEQPASSPTSQAHNLPQHAVRGVPVTVETTLRTKGVWIRQFVFDANPNTFFASADNPGPRDHFTLVFDQPVAVSAISVRTGTPNDAEPLTAGKLEVSADGTTFDPLAEFVRGSVHGDAGGRKLLAVRIRPTAQPHPLIIREVTIQADPPLAVFRHPIEFSIDVTDARDMAKWAERAVRTCERAYPMICDELAAEGFHPPLHIPFEVRRDAPAIASATNGRLIASAGYFEANPHDLGALVHTTSFLVQAYHGRSTPAWLVHGIADYIRFFKFEAGAIGPPDPDTARHDGDSRETAAFLAYLVAKYDPTLVRRLNAALREGRYTDNIWLALTGKPLHELGEEWRQSLRR